jgi:hypothetical protein
MLRKKMEQSIKGENIRTQSDGRTCNWNTSRRRWVRSTIKKDNGCIFPEVMIGVNPRA